MFSILPHLIPRPALLLCSRLGEDGSRRAGASFPTLYAAPSAYICLTHLDASAPPYSSWEA